MPPAFVLSQDQTLKFIPGPPDRRTTASGAAPTRPAPRQGPPNVRNTNARTFSGPTAAVRASLPISTISINKSPRTQIGLHRPLGPVFPGTIPGLGPEPHPVKGAALIPPGLKPSQSPFSRSADLDVGARVSAEAKIGTVTPVVQRNPPQKLHRRHISPSARSSASMCSGAGSSPPAARSGGATACGR